MNGKVHGAAGMALSSFVLTIHPQNPVVTTAAIIGSAFLAILSDVDHAGSSISQLPGFNLVSRILSLILKHRGFTHSLAAVVLLFIILKQNDFKPILIWIWVGAFFSHIFLDLFNEQGVQLLWPLPYKIALLPGMISVSSQPYSLVQTVLFQTFFWLSAIFSIHTFMTISLGYSQLKFAGEFWFQYVAPYIPII
ncbi:metal-dependent hydrolase [Paenibacillus macquariensis]|uniref:Inner membrane protein n=1 Tax=Paenibacillus macquariensis TaxID=948756 RepID=A0ABY1KEI7_9BACL|nr:metal-dependent hydrolase [Paenibacillus macquariensis]OAB28403.1 hypothetical protein PMSM_24415 [Paenibacillus macquariensis subsp. macquariensis]SIR71546.1 inner membrane protein [Paenibacillus macquariensis]